MIKYIIPARFVRFQRSILVFDVLAALSCYLCIIPLVLLDFFIWQFQHIYFRTFQIPLIRRSDYLVFDRFHLSKLTLWQKVNCLYCEYANGLVAYSKAVVNQMELYSCAIKHAHQPLGQEHHKDFYDRKEFE